MENRPEIKVLVVEDDDGDFVLTQSYLAGSPYQRYCLQWARDSEAALDLVKAPFDVCLMDYQLGAEDGVVLAKRLTDMGLKAPIVMLTGMRRREVDLEAMEAGVAEYLVKDQVNSEILERTIRYVIERAALLNLVRQHEARLQDEVIHDEIAGVFNRRHFMGRLAEERRAAANHDYPLAVAMIEVHDIKRINEIFGHRAGDDAIHALGELLAEAMEPGEVCGRYSGPEFCAYFPHQTTAQVRDRIEAIRRDFESQVFRTLEGSPFVAKASAGVIDVPENDETVYDVLDSVGFALIATADRKSEEETRFARVDALLLQKHSAGEGLRRAA